MGEEVKRTTYNRTHRREYRRKVRLCLDVFETMLAQSRFDSDRPLTGMEIECNLVDADYQPAMEAGMRQHLLAQRPTALGAAPRVICLSSCAAHGSSLISWKSQHELVSTLSWKSALMIWGGPVLTLVSAYFIALQFDWL